LPQQPALDRGVGQRGSSDLERHPRPLGIAT